MKGTESPKGVEYEPGVQVEKAKGKTYAKDAKDIVNNII